MYNLQPIIHEFSITGFHFIYSFELSKHFSHPTEVHNFWEIAYMDNGEGYSVTNGTTRPLKQGEVVFHAPMEAHAHISNQKVANNLLIVAFSVNDNAALSALKGKTFLLDKSSRTQLSLFFKEAANALGKLPNNYFDKENLDFSSAPFGSLQLLQCYLTEFLIDLIRGGHSSVSKTPPDSLARNNSDSALVNLITEYLNATLYRPLTLKDLCEHFALGTSQLSKIFKEHTGSSPMEFYTFLKIQEAKKLLREKDLSVSEIASVLGYSSIHIFSRAFKQRTGFSPTAYQKSIL